MSLRSLSDYIFVTKYARYLPELKRRETWDEAINRVKQMHLDVYKDKGVEEEIEWAFQLVKHKRVLGSQRTLQNAGSPVLRQNPRSFNCSFSQCDRLKFFQDAFYLLLCGVGVGLGVQKHYIEKLPKFSRKMDDPKLIGHSNNNPVYDVGFLEVKKFVVPDTIEGWADSLGVLLSSYFENPIFPEYANCYVEFDFSLIRTKGSSISSGIGKAPGPDGLSASLKKIRSLLDECLDNGREKLRPIDTYDIICFASDAVLSGGIRRSALITLIDLDDKEMMNAKTGNWMQENPQRARSNNSVMLLRDNTTKEQFLEVIKYTKEFGEPGFFWCDNILQGLNPCQPGWAKVLTIWGVREIKDIHIGDKIWSEDGFVTVKNKWSTGIQEVFKFRTTAGIFYGTENHMVVSYGGKIEAKDADGIDILVGPVPTYYKINPQDVMDGLVIGDGSVHKASNDFVYLLIGENDQDYFESEVKDLIISKRGICSTSYEIRTSISSDELEKTFNRTIPKRLRTNGASTTIGFLRGLFSANGSICGDRVTLKQASLELIEQAQEMLSSIGIRSYITTNKAVQIQHHNGIYESKESYTLNITKGRWLFRDLIGFLQNYKNEKLGQICLKGQGRTKDTYDIIEKILISKEEVFDIEVNGTSHTYWSSGLNVSNCAEIGLIGYDKDGNPGFHFCNLVDINGKKIKTEEDFLECCKAAAIIGTLQAGYTNFPYLGEVSENIAKYEALLGCGITGIMDSPDILLDPETLQKGAALIIKTNEEIAAKIGIKPAARLTTVKPSGTTSLILGSSSGIHPHHARRYFRRVQANKMEIPLQLFKKYNPMAVEESVWSANKTDEIVTFCVEVPEGTRTKNQMSAIELLKSVKLVKENWIDKGKVVERCLQPWLSHSVSNTINVRDDEWDEVIDYIYENRNVFVGVSLLPIAGDKDYPQAPNCTVFTAQEIVKEYGDASIFASGVIESALEAFEDDLWKACKAVLNLDEAASYPINQANFILKAKSFANKYFDGNIKKMTYCLKDVANWYLWVNLKDSYKEVDFSEMVEEDNGTDMREEVACGGGACEISF